MKVTERARYAPLVLLLLVLGCAEVEIRKVGEEDGPEGMRFYMPRPYVAVNEPFIVSGEAYLVGGQITPDGKYVLINDIDTSKTTNNHYLQRFLASTDKTIAATSVVVPPAADRDGGGGATGRDQSSGETPPPSTPPQPQPDPQTRSEEKSGILGLKVTNDNSAYALTPLKRYFDVLWLPDFDEQYVVHGEAGMGNASIAMQMGQGWSLQGLEATVDNSAITGRIFGLIDEGTRMLSTLGRAQLGLPPTPMGGGEQSAGEGPSAANFESGTPLTIKVTFVRIAAPGLYPILKPSEMANLPAPSADVANRILIPVAPYTNIAFNTYEGVVVEAALATGDNALRLHQYIDLRGGGGSGNPGGGRGIEAEYWPALSRRASTEFGLRIGVNPPVGSNVVQITIRKQDGSSMPEDDPDRAKQQDVVDWVVAELKKKAPTFQPRPDVRFP